jgi:hypothetical protein
MAYPNTRSFTSKRNQARARATGSDGGGSRSGRASGARSARANATRGTEAVVERTNADADADANAAGGPNGANAGADGQVQLGGRHRQSIQHLRQGLQHAEQILLHPQQGAGASPAGGGELTQAEVAQLTQDVAGIILSGDSLGSGGSDNGPGLVAFLHEANRLMGQNNSGAATIDTAGVLALFGIMAAQLTDQERQLQQHRQELNDLRTLFRIQQQQQQLQQLQLQQEEREEQE